MIGYFKYNQAVSKSQAYIFFNPYIQCFKKNFPKNSKKFIDAFNDAFNRLLFNYPLCHDKKIPKKFERSIINSKQS